MSSDTGLHGSSIGRLGSISSQLSCDCCAPHWVEVLVPSPRLQEMSTSTTSFDWIFRNSPIPSRIDAISVFIPIPSIISCWPRQFDARHQANICLVRSYWRMEMETKCHKQPPPPPTPKQVEGPYMEINIERTFLVLRVISIIQRKTLIHAHQTQYSSQHSINSFPFFFPLPFSLFSFSPFPFTSKKNPHSIFENFIL